MKNLYNALQLKQLYQLRNLGYKYTLAKPFSYEEQNSLKLPNTIEELKVQAKNCHLCSLSKGRKQTVFGEGAFDADIMIVGDIPMEIEDSEGRPFLGKGGEMLTLMIEKVLGLPREEAYLTNLIKCHSSSSQELDETQIHTCKAYLFKEIELIRPKLIVTLGELAYHYISGEQSSLEEARGLVIEKENYMIIPTYHPNSLLKNPSLKIKVFEDLKKIRSNML